ncbi:GGDEF domain-containing protein [Rheinheimera sp.]|uniref:GGDEF domain-containing protein n=1 Tax=Rheinheimera sp. TaxID=1869214 RepID=UPI00273382EC|nr:GGDEF domain-containing protein [Rheinheimera sp.]MDP2714194.1 GGDEF domain-containing protein [Rheinheimera sp.]
MADILPYFLAGIVAGAALTGIAAAIKLLRWQKTAAELECQLRSHSFELQITLDELAEKNLQLEQQSLTDALSGVYNRAYFDRQMRAELKRSRRELRTLALVLLDIDHFKRLNDNFGHLVGDQAITAVAQLIKQQLKRPADKLCRYGGEEFALILPNTGKEGAVQLAEQIRQQLATSPLLCNQQAVTITLSAGCYAAVPGPDSDNDEYIGFADKALYRAKAAGRDQVQSYPPITVPQQPEAVTGDVDEH